MLLNPFGSLMAENIHAQVSPKLKILMALPGQKIFIPSHGQKYFMGGQEYWWLSHGQKYLCPSRPKFEKLKFHHLFVAGQKTNKMYLCENKNSNFLLNNYR